MLYGCLVITAGAWQAESLWNIGVQPAALLDAFCVKKDMQKMFEESQILYVDA